MPAKHLPGKTIELRPEPGESWDMVGDDVTFPAQEGAAIWLFPGNVTRATLMAEQILQGIPVYVEVDDNYTRHPAIPQLSAWLTTRDTTGRDRHSYEIHQRIVRFSDGVICSTEKLASIYRNMNDNVHVCRNSVDPADWPHSAEHSLDGVLRVGWAGSESHAYDLADIEPALDWAARQPATEVVTFGWQPPRLHNAKVANPDGYHYRHIPWTESLAEFRQKVSAIDVMLCPLRPSAWADCKSDVKALEAAMGGACVVVSKTEPYRPWWDGEAPGYVAETKKDFVKICKHLIAHRDEARQMAEEARRYALTRSIEHGIRQWKEALSA